MPEAFERESLQLGFIAIRRHVEIGYFGGMLVVNEYARPLEFHCTVPVKPSRAQEILYGPSLDEFLCGEHIALALVKKMKSPPSILFVDSLPACGLRRVQNAPVVCIVGEQSSTNIETPFQVVGSTAQDHLDGIEAKTFAQFSDDLSQARELLDRYKPNVDLQEPFHRVVQALLEAHPNAKAA